MEVIHNIYNTNTHPTQDAAILYIIRVFQHLLYTKTYIMKTNLFIETLQEKYGVKDGTTNTLRLLINSIPAKTLISGKFTLIKTDINFNFALEQIKQIAILFKYTSYDWGNKTETNITWKCVGNDIEDTTDKIINSKQISNSNGLIVNILFRNKYTPIIRIKTAFIK